MIKYNTTDFEENMYDFFTCLWYKGKLFTGILLDDDEKGTTEFKNGNADGRSLSYYENGQLEEDCIYEDGNYIKGKHWYSNGQMKYDSELKTTWDEDGKIIIKDRSWLYKNGNLRFSHDSEGNGLYFSSQQELAIKVIYSKGKPHLTKHFYYNKVLLNCYKELLEHIYIDHEKNFNFSQLIEHNVISWIIKLYSKNNKKEALDLLRDIANHSEKIIDKNCDFRIKHMEENIKNHVNDVIQRMQNKEFDKSNLKNPDDYSVIIFD